MTDWSRLFYRKFRPAFREIERLENRIYQQDSLLIFKWHRYTIDELINSEHHYKIDSITRKIGDDATVWYKRGEMPQDGQIIYENKKFDLEEALHKVNLQIERRRPTLWEQATGVFNEFVQRVMHNLPELIRTPLENMVLEIIGLPIIGFLGRMLLPTQKDETKLL
ncbi:MAG: hypothetical protein AB4426_04290, partial [Xenococcaceae cyanobacterium]